jgi:hypothetical protein
MSPEERIYSAVVEWSGRHGGSGGDTPDEVWQLTLTNLARGYEPTLLTITCVRCHRARKAVRWTCDGRLADSWGYVEFDDPGNICSDCLGESFIGPTITLADEPEA